MNTDNRTPGWYLLTPAGLAGPYRWREDAVRARPVGTLWPVQRVREPCGCGGLCDSTEPCPMAEGTSA